VPTNNEDHLISKFFIFDFNDFTDGISRFSITVGQVLGGVPTGCEMHDGEF